MKRITQAITCIGMIGGLSAAIGVGGIANAGVSAVTFEGARSYTRVYVDGQQCYIESNGQCNTDINLYNGYPGIKGGVLYRVRYSMQPSNGGFAADEIAHLDAWIQIPYLGGNDSNPAAYTVTIPMSRVSFENGPGYSDGGYVVYAVSSDNVGQYLDATRPKKHNSALGFKVGNTAGGPITDVTLLAGCYTISFASPWNNTGTGGQRPITKYWTLEDPVCVDGVNDQTINASAP